MLYGWHCSGCEKDAEHFEHHPDDKGAESYVCACGHSMAPAVSLGTSLVWFEEGRERIIPNLNYLDEQGNEHSQPIRSWKDYQRAKKRAGVTEAGNRMGEKGVWI